MKSFKQFNENLDSKIDLLVKLEDQKAKLEKAVALNKGSNTKRAYDLQDKYNDLKDKAEDMGVWDIFCKKMKLSTKHDARDYWA